MSEEAERPCPPEILALAEALGRMLARRDHAAEQRRTEPEGTGDEQNASFDTAGLR